MEENESARPSGLIRKLFSVIGKRGAERLTVLIIAESEADAAYYALKELHLETLIDVDLVSDTVHIVGQGSGAHSHRLL